MSEDASAAEATAVALEELVRELQRAAASLRAGGLEPDAAAALVDACARTAAQASSELERLVRSAAAEPLPSPPSQGQLL